MEPSKSRGQKPPTGKRKLAVFFAVVVALALTLGPSLVLNLALIYLPDMGGPKVSYTKAEAGFLFRTISITGLDTAPIANKPWRITAGAVKLQGISVINTIQWLLDPQSRPPSTLSLVQDLSIQDLAVVGSTGQKQKISMSQATIQNLSWNGSNPNTLPVAFTEVNLTNMKGKAGLIDLNFGELLLKDLGADSLSLKISDLFFKNMANQTELKFQNMALRKVHTTDIVGMLQGTITLGPWWVISALPQLELNEAIYTKGGKEQLALTTTHSKSSRDKNNPDSLDTFHRFLKFKVGSKQLENWLKLAPQWNLKDIFGPHLAGKLTLSWGYKEGSKGRFKLQKAVIDLNNLGILNMSGDFYGVKKLNPHLDSTQLLFSAMKWEIANLSIAYKDHGLTKKLYALLDKTVFINQPQGKTASKIQTQYLNPWLESLQPEAALDILPTLKAELSTYLRQPKSFMVTINPHRPLLLLTSINMNIVDLIKKINITVQVNERPPLAITAHNTGLIKKQIKIPQPLKNLFTDENP